ARPEAGDALPPVAPQFLLPLSSAARSRVRGALARAPPPPIETAHAGSGFAARAAAGRCTTGDPRAVGRLPDRVAEPGGGPRPRGPPRQFPAGGNDRRGPHRRRVPGGGLAIIQPYRAHEDVKGRYPRVVEELLQIKRALVRKSGAPG